MWARVPFLARCACRRAQGPAARCARLAGCASGRVGLGLRPPCMRLPAWGAAVWVWTSLSQTHVRPAPPPQLTCTSPSFEELALRLMEAGEGEAVLAFLTARLGTLGREDRAQVGGQGEGGREGGREGGAGPEVWALAFPRRCPLTTLG